MHGVTHGPVVQSRPRRMPLALTASSSVWASSAQSSANSKSRMICDWIFVCDIAADRIANLHTWKNVSGQFTLGYSTIHCLNPAKSDAIVFTPSRWQHTMKLDKICFWSTSHSIFNCEEFWRSSRQHGSTRCWRLQVAPCEIISAWWRCTNCCL